MVWYGMVRYGEERKERTNEGMKVSVWYGSKVKARND
jgi:hypothetical protein